VHLGAPGHRETGGVLMYIVRRLAGSPLLAQPPQPSIRVLVRSVLSDDDHDNALRAFPDLWDTIFFSDAAQASVER